MDDLSKIERRLARLESRNLSGMGHEATLLHHRRLGDMRVEVIRAAIREVVEPDAADAWMDSPNKMFGGSTPAAAARTDPDIVRSAIHALASGEPN